MYFFAFFFRSHSNIGSQRPNLKLGFLVLGLMLIRVRVDVVFKLRLSFLRANPNLILTYFEIRPMTSDITVTKQIYAKKYLSYIQGEAEGLIEAPRQLIALETSLVQAQQLRRAE